MELTIRCWPRIAKLPMCILLLLWLIPRSAFTQSTELTKGTMSFTTEGIYNRHGWRIPGLVKARVKEPPHDAGDHETKGLLLEVLKPVAPKDSITIVGAAPGRADLLEVFEEAVDVTEIQRFILNDRTFGYLVLGTVVGTDANGNRIHFGSQERIYYYDPDGSGKFKMMKYAGAMHFEIVIPDWVKKSLASKDR